MSNSPVARRDFLALILAAGCWGIGTVISKAALAEIPPFTLLAVQLASSLAILSLLMSIRPSTAKRHLADLRARSGLTTEQLIYAGRAEGWLVSRVSNPN